MKPVKSAEVEGTGRPGLTSLIQTSRGILTVQTEILGEPSRLVTIVDFRGRVLKTWRSGFEVRSTEIEQARTWHQEIELEVRRMLSQATQKESSREGFVGACLFIEAMRAYGSRDFDRAEFLLTSCAKLVGENQLVLVALKRVQKLNQG